MQKIEKRFENFNHLGFFPPYVYNGDFFDSFQDAIAQIPNKDLKIDKAAVCEFVSKFYFLGDRTILEGLRKVPWHAKPICEKQNWLLEEIPCHGEKQISAYAAAETLSKLLKQEVLSYIKKARCVGILLSGGMDSRVLAAVLAEVIRCEQLNIDVIAINWGINGCRDHVYAKKIAEKYHWEFLHFGLGCENLIENIDFAAERGCEFSPYHLHAMPRVRSLSGLDCILASSFGDSIGRGMYSGTHILNLPDILSNYRNRFRIFHEDVFKRQFSEVFADVSLYRHRFPKERKWQRNEIDRQVHYWRRQLNPCMAVINEKIPLYQAFGDPKIYRFMWDLSPQLRNDQIYYELLLQVDKKLLEIPWAANGRIFWVGSDKLDDLSSQHNQYGFWIRNELHDEIRNLVISDEISKLGVFNMAMLERLVQINHALSRGTQANRIDQILIWIAALSKMIKIFKIHGAKEVRSRTSLAGIAETMGYCALKNVKG